MRCLPYLWHGKHLPCVQVLSLLSLLMFTAVVSLTCWSTCPRDPRERQGRAGRFTGAQVAWLLTGAPGCHTATSLCVNAVPLWVCSGKSVRTSSVRAPLIAQSRSVCLKGGFGPYWFVYSCNNFICLQLEEILDSVQVIRGIIPAGGVVAILLSLYSWVW